MSDLEAERAFYEKLGLSLIYEGSEYPNLIAFSAGTGEFGIQRSSAQNDPPSVLTWQLGVADIEEAIEVCNRAGLSFEMELNEPAPGWRYHRLLLQSPSGFRVALEGPNE